MASGESLCDTWTTRAKNINDLALQDSPLEFVCWIPIVEGVFGAISARPPSICLWKGYYMIRREACLKMPVCDIVQRNANRVRLNDRRFSDGLGKSRDLI